jgi:hypothetical protein
MLNSHRALPSAGSDAGATTPPHAAERTAHGMAYGTAYGMPTLALVAARQQLELALQLSIGGCELAQLPHLE